MRRLLLLAWLLSASLGSAQILIQPDPRASSYVFYAGQPPRAVISPMTNEEQTRFKQVYDAVLKSSVTLDQEGDALSASFDNYRKTLLAAMVKADPAVGPVLASDGRMTSAQSDEIRHAQASAMQADPNLQTQWDDLTKKMIAHQQAVDAAMVKLDPAVAPILAKLSP